MCHRYFQYRLTDKQMEKTCGQSSQGRLLVASRLCSPQPGELDLSIHSLPRTMSANGVSGKSLVRNLALEMLVSVQTTPPQQHPQDIQQTLIPSDFLRVEENHTALIISPLLFWPREHEHAWQREARGAVSTYRGLGPSQGKQCSSRKGRRGEKQGQKLDLLSTEATQLSLVCLK